VGPGKAVGFLQSLGWRLFETLKIYCGLCFPAPQLNRYASGNQRGKYAIWENKEAKSKGHLA
jgi:hypothetical protein